MEQLTKQVKGEMFRTLIWLVIAVAAALGIGSLIW